jgi:hypothetical protein
MRWLAATAATAGILVAGWIALGGVGRAAIFASCRIDGMRLAVLVQGAEKTEQHTTALSITNVASRSCSLNGYPALALFDGSGRTLPFAYAYRGDQMITAARPMRVRLAAGASAFFAFNKNACIGLTHRYARTVRVMLPARRLGRTVRLPRRLVDYCGPRDPGHVVTVSPIVRRRLDAFCLTQGTCKRG